ncbi:lachesin-like isoform X2 [Leptotrombidium deliense]|uniref:Lachesin-like isoform X2 n=1 Tax=Leptotrombidium deliense TaxID=299467 RepID=A0A443SFK8_9ACAR|nr:lachesin-like isoform X2 [Leptotrombidium deliense]
MKSPFLLCFFTYILAVKGQQTPTISHISSNKVVKIGDTIDLRCSVQYAANYPVIWSKVNKDNPSANFLISKGSALSTSDNRYSIRHDEASSTFTLQLSKIQEWDAGTYQCQLPISTTSRVTQNVVVTVLIKPVINDSGPRTISTAPHKSIKLECFANGNPTPEISWRRRNNELLPTGGEVYYGNILRIDNVTKHDRGTYYCLANNGVGKTVKRNFEVEVKFAPDVTVPKEMYSQAIGHPVDLECHVKGFPTPTIYWIKNGAQLYDDKNYQLTLTTSAFDTTVTVLRIISVSHSKLGSYICRGDNDYGSNEKIIKVQLADHPVCPPACGVNNFAVIRSNLRTIVSLLVFALFTHYF